MVFVGNIHHFRFPRCHTLVAQCHSQDRQDPFTTSLSRVFFFCNFWGLQMLMEHGMFIFWCVFNICTTSTFSWNDQFFIEHSKRQFISCSSSMQVYIYTHGQKNKTIKFQVYPHNGWFNPHVCCLKPKFPSYPNIAIYIISCIYDIYIIIPYIYRIYHSQPSISPRCSTWTSPGHWAPALPFAGAPAADAAPPWPPHRCSSPWLAPPAPRSRTPGRRPPGCSRIRCEATRAPWWMCRVTKLPWDGGIFGGIAM